MGTSKHPYRHTELVSTLPVKTHLMRKLRVNPAMTGLLFEVDKKR
jgi:hypothetical protein